MKQIKDNDIWQANINITSVKKKIYTIYRKWKGKNDMQIKKLKYELIERTQNNDFFTNEAF